MNNFLKHTFVSFVGVAIAVIVVMICSAIAGESVDDVVGWIALGIAGGCSMAKQDRY